MFEIVLSAVLPLYAFIFLGFLAGRRLEVDRASIAALIFYLVLPVLLFAAVWRTPLKPELLALPVITFLLSCALCLITYRVASLKWKGGARNVLALAAGNGNMGFFGLPVAAALLPAEALGIYILGMFGVTLYENSLGYYITARGRHTGREALRQIARLPSLYAFLLGLFMHLLPLPFPHFMETLLTEVRGAYCVLGMLMIGLGLASVRGFRLDVAFTAATLISTYVVWPLAALGLIWLDVHWVGLYDQTVHLVLFLLSIVPMAVQSVIVSTLLKVEPEKTATAVLVSTVVALAAVPIMLGWYL